MIETTKQTKHMSVLNYIGFTHLQSTNPTFTSLSQNQIWPLPHPLWVIAKCPMWTDGSRVAVICTLPESGALKSALNMIIFAHQFPLVYNVNSAIAHIYIHM